MNAGPLLRTLVLLTVCRMYHSATTEPVCQDNIPDCAEYGPTACTDPYLSWAHTNCPQFCNFCKSENAVPTTRMPTPTKGVCKDVLPDCPEYTKASCVGRYTTWAKQHCAKFCGFCSSTTTSSPTGQVCIYKGQTYSEGQTWKDGCTYNCSCLANGFYRCTDLCPTFQNLPPECKYVIKPGQCCKELTCANTTTVITNFTLPAINACVYNGQTYKTGQVWQDGCKYNCTCLNDTIGYYRCSDLCPTYVHLSPFCSVVKEPGECCGKLKCSTHLNGTGSTNVTNPLAVDNLCYYKGKNYTEGQKWTDGCAYKCTCVDGPRGYYMCQTRCTQWNLPKACHLQDPAPGKCCKTPKCPAGYAITYPPGYTEE